MIFLNFKEKFEHEYGDTYTLNKCKDKGCSLKDVSKEDYFIINGDKLEKLDKKSVDCIIIDLKEYYDNEYKIILCELTKGTKELKDAVEKFQSSGELIIKYLNDLDASVYTINCLLLGKIVKNGKIIDKKQLLNKFKVKGYDCTLLIQNEKCDFSIKQLNNT